MLSGFCVIETTSGVVDGHVSTNYPRGRFFPQVGTNYPRGHFLFFVFLFLLPGQKVVQIDRFELLACQRLFEGREL